MEYAKCRREQNNLPHPWTLGNGWRCLPLFKKVDKDFRGSQGLLTYSRHDCLLSILRFSQFNSDLFYLLQYPSGDNS